MSDAERSIAGHFGGARRKPGHVGHRQTDTVQVSLARNARNLARESRGVEQRHAPVVGYSIPIAFKRIVHQHRDHTRQTSRQPPRVPIIVRRHNQGAARRRTLDCISQRRFVHLPRRAETEVDEVRAGVCRPVDAGDEGRHVRRQRPVEHLDGKQLRVGRLLTDRRGDCRPVAEPVQVVRTLDALLVDRDAARDLADVWMGGIDAAVDHGHAHAAAGQHRERIKVVAICF